MYAIPRPPVRRLGASLLAGLLAGAVLAPSGASADETPDPTAHLAATASAASDDMVSLTLADPPSEGSDTAATDDGADPPSEGSDAESDADPAGPEHEVAPDERSLVTATCEDRLTVISWNGATDSGDDRAVFVTAQLLEAGTAGWASAAWDTAPGTTLRTVFATGIDGTVTELAPTPTGTVADVTTLTFCGTGTAPAEVPAPGTPIDAVCDDLLAVATPEGITGDDLAVALTARASERGVPGWSNVGWAAAPATTLRTVLVTGIDGTVRDAGDATSATDVASLTFCGTAGRPAGAETPNRPSAPSTDTPTPPARPTPAPTTSTSPTSTSAPSTSATSTPGLSASMVSSRATGSTGASAHSATTGTTEGPGDGTDPGPPGVVRVDTPAAGDDRGGGAPVPEPATGPGIVGDEEETEVLGVQLTRENEPAGSGPLGAGVAILAVLALLATAGGILWSRRS